LATRVGNILELLIRGRPLLAQFFGRTEQQTQKPVHEKLREKH